MSAPSPYPTYRSVWRRRLRPIYLEMYVKPFLASSIMAYSHCTGPGQVQGTGPGAVGPNMLYRNALTGPRQRKEPGSIASFCAGPVPYTCPGPVPVQCEQAITLHYGLTSGISVYLIVRSQLPNVVAHSGEGQGTGRSYVHLNTWP